MTVQSLTPDDDTPRVLVLCTGGTVSMEATPDGLRPMVGFGARLREALHATGAALPAFDVVELEQAIDSANLSPLHWLRMAEPLIARWDAYTGFVVLHGTDTMAWSASALSFMLRGLNKPVVFTGSQRPLLQPGSDAPHHLCSALELAAHHAVHEVGLCFGRHLWRGNRTRKLHSQALAAFGSPNALPLADLATGSAPVRVHRKRLLASQARQFVLPALRPRDVAVLALHPGVNGRLVDAVLDATGARGLLMLSYGVGNAPDDGCFLKSLERATARGVVVLNTTQCPGGSVEQGVYATGSALTRAGVVGGGDLTPEAALAKLHVVLGTETDPERIRRSLVKPMCGEMNPSPEPEPEGHRDAWQT